MENPELLAEVRAKINEIVQAAIASESVGVDMLFLYTSLQILEKLEAMHETLKSIDGSVDATANILAEQTGRTIYTMLSKRDMPS